MFGKENRHHLLLGGATFSLGAATMAIEMTASRIVAPYFGASLFVWTSLIVTVLLSMSVGYWLGGKVAEKNAELHHAGILSLSSAASLYIGAHLVPKIAPSLATNISAVTDASTALFLGSFLFTLLAFALPVLFLASAGPILLKSWAKGGDVGSTAGSYFATSTAGSVLGTVAPTLILVPTIGAKSTMDAVVILLVAVATLLLKRSTKKLVVLAVVPLTIIAPLTTPVASPFVLAQNESPYQLIRVIGDQEGTRHLTFNDASAIQSTYNPNDDRLLPYVEMMGISAVARAPKMENDKATFHGLILGLAGGGIARSYHQMLPTTTIPHITGVEIDPEVISIAKKWFALDELGVNVINADARTFLMNSTESYDSVAIDAYSVQLYIPPHLATEEFFRLVASRLNADGVVSTNINAPSKDSRLLKTMLNTVASVFPYVLVVPVSDAWNYAVFASKTPLMQSEIASRLTDGSVALTALTSAYEIQYDRNQEVFTDDRAPIEFMTDTMIFGSLR